MLFNEIELSEDLIFELNKVIEKLNYDKKICNLDDYDESITKQHCLKRVSLKSLEEIRLDRNVATADENLIRIPPKFVKKTKIPKLFEKLIKDVSGINEGLFHVTGKFWYPKNGYMGWHTNNVYPGYRFYCSHVKEEGKSFFRYQHPETKEIFTSYDKVGWMGRLFKIDKQKPLWHCVYSETNRISTGCNLTIN